MTNLSEYKPEEAQGPAEARGRSPLPRACAAPIDCSRKLDCWNRIENDRHHKSEEKPNKRQKNQTNADRLHFRVSKPEDLHKT